MSDYIEVKKLTKIYKDGKSEVVALEDVSFNLGEGDDLAILGSSGSGKTTLLQLMGGLNRPTSGTVNIQGRDVWKGSDSVVSKFRNQTMGFVFQMIHLQDYLTAEENVMVPMLVAGKSQASARTRAKKLLDQVGLKERANHSPSAMSGGEMQRVAVARSLANNPKIIFADEPTGKLDKKNTENILGILDEIAKKEKVSVVMITHDEGVAKRFKNILHLEHGKTKKLKLANQVK